MRRRAIALRCVSERLMSIDSSTVVEGKSARTASSIAGPAAATRNSTPGESASFPSFATPPNIHRSMPMIGMPFRIATHA